MYLTRMRLNESNPNTAKALASPHIFHGTVERCFGGERKRNLWRIESEYRFI
ncbi:MAG: type I-E CRISPR-associated protein Cas6/Cse3/CasE [Acutalibacteraceae bacterium]